MHSPTTTTIRHQRGELTTKRLLACGAMAGPLFVITLLAQGAARAHYDPIRHPGSSLALGNLGWIQDVNFITGGLLTLAFAIGLRSALRPGKGSTWAPLLVGWWAIGLIGAGIFVTDPVNGYPPGTPNQVQQPTIHGSLHDLFSVPALLALLAACFVLTRRFATRGQRGWAVYSAATGTAFTAALILASMAFAQATGLMDYGGLFQRIMLTIGWGWLTLLALHLLRHDNTRHPATQP
jgi:Protein of unknown function (DUF998)